MSLAFYCEFCSPPGRSSWLFQLIDDYASDSDVQNLVDTYDWYFIPIVNPDGYVYSWEAVSYIIFYIILSIDVSLSAFTHWQ